MTELGESRIIRKQNGAVIAPYRAATAIWTEFG
jgi:hypothetical protein